MPPAELIDPQCRAGVFVTLRAMRLLLAMHATLGASIQQVLLSRAEPQVIQVAALAVVAGVAHIELALDLPFR
jgi:hypothetical protein